MYTMSSRVINPSPALKKGFSSSSPDLLGGPESAMSLTGTLQKSALLGLILFATALVAAQLNLSSWVILFALAAFGLALLISFKAIHAPRLSPVYAVLQGVAVGTISDWYSAAYGGMIVVYALGMTAAIFLALLIVYASGMIKVTQNFKLTVATATLGIMLYYLAAIALGFFGVSVPLIADTGLFGIIFSVFVVLIASANLVIDFDFIEHGIESRYPKHMEWFAAFGLLVTLVWLYLELLRLLAKLMSRRD